MGADRGGRVRGLAWRYSTPPQRLALAEVIPEIGALPHINDKQALALPSRRYS